MRRYPTLLPLEGEYKTDEPISKVREVAIWLLKVFGSIRENYLSP